MAGEGTQESTVALTREKSFVSNEGLNVLTLTYQGPYAELLDKLKGVTFFTPYSGDGRDEFPEGGATSSGAEWGEPFAARGVLRRGAGDVSSLEIQVYQVRQMGIWGLDFAEVSKPIISWKPKDDETIDYKLLKAWQKLGTENPASSDYNEYKVDETELSGATKTLAEMMYRGIETFVVYMPVVTWQARVFMPPIVDQYPVGVQTASLEAPCGLKELGEKGFVDQINAIKNPWTGKDFIWVRSASRVATNPDGTYTWFMQFLAVDSADKDLYPEA